MRKALMVVLLLSFCRTAHAADPNPSRTLKQVQAVVEEMVAIEKKVPKEVVDSSLCLVVFPWMDLKALAPDSTGAFRLVFANGEGAAFCRSGDSLSGPWSAPFLFHMDATGANKNQWGAKTDVVLFLMTARAAEALRSGEFDLKALKCQEGQLAPPEPGGAPAALPDVLAFSLPWIRPMSTQQKYTAESLGGLSLLPSASSAKADAAAAEKLYGKAVNPAEVLRQAGGEPGQPAEVLVLLLESRSPSLPRTTTIRQPSAPVTDATVEVQGLAAGYRTVEKIELAGVPADVSVGEAGVEFKVSVPLELGVNALEGVITEANGVQESFQVSVERVAPPKPAPKPQPKRRAAPKP